MFVRNTGTKPVYTESGAWIAPGEVYRCKKAEGEALLTNPNISHSEDTPDDGSRRKVPAKSGK